MVTFECPWCAEPAIVEASSLQELTCGECAVSVEIAPDPIQEHAERAA